MDLRAKPFYLDDDQISWVNETLANMTTDEKVGQLFCMNISDFSEKTMDDLFDLTYVGGVMYRECPLKDALDFTERIQKRSKVPVLIAANIEKGGDGIVLEGTQIGSEMGVAATGEDDMVVKLATVAGKEAEAAGANWAFAPILDIDYNFRNPITNVRTFGDDPERVKRLGKLYVDTVQDGHVAACIKHFPGDGRDERDQHLCTTINDLSCEEWDATYGAIYQACIDEGALTCMVGHIMQPAYTKKLNPDIEDSEIMPGSLSSEIMQGLLRGKLGFNGLICTDATTMNGYEIPLPRDVALPQSIENGADMVLFCRNMKEDYELMKGGLEKGILSEERLDEAVTRILATKAALGLDKGAYIPTAEEAGKVIGCEEHKRWARECADKAITLVKEEPGVLPLDSNRYKRILLCPIENDDPDSYFNQVKPVRGKIKEALEAEGFEVTYFTPDPNLEGYAELSTYYSDNFDLCLYIINLATQSNQTTVRIEWEQPLGANCPRMVTQIPTIAVSVCNPYHLLDMPRVRTFINCYSSNDETLQALIDKLMGRSTYKGISPVDPFCGKWDTRLQ